MSVAPVGIAPVPSLAAHARRLFARHGTIRVLVGSNLKAGHRDKVLGHLWSLLDPLMFMLVYYFVFGFLFKLGGDGGGGRSTAFMLYILVGVLTYRFIDGTISQSALCIRSNRGLIHEINFPKSVFPVSIALSRLYDLLWGIVALMIFLLVAGIWPTIHYLWLPLLIAVSFTLAVGAAFVVAYLGAFYADTVNVVNVAMRLMFYCSPIFYFVREPPGAPGAPVLLEGHDTIRLLYMLNPIACLLECYRDAMLWGVAPEARLLWYVTWISAALCMAGFALFSRGEGKFAKYV